MNIIPDIHGKKTSLIGAFFSCLVATICAPSCAYRLTNLHVQAPNQIKTIAIESIFDTSAEVIPHEQLWGELQRAFAANGHLKVTSAKNADALVRAHLQTASVTKAGDKPGSRGDRKDPELYERIGAPLNPNRFRNINIADNYFTKDQINFLVDIEVWDLRDRKLLLQRTYSGGFSVHNDTFVTGLNELVFVQREESINYGTLKSAKQIAETVVSDLLIR